MSSGTAPAGGEPRADTGIDDSALRALAGYQIRRADIAMQQAFNLEIRAVYDLRPVELSVLMLLAHNPGLRQSRLGLALGVAAPNMVAVMSQLAERGLIAGRPDPADGRARVWVLTEAGHALQTEVYDAVRVMEARLLGRARSAVLEGLDALWQAEGDASSDPASD